MTDTQSGDTGSGEWCPCYAEEKARAGVHAWHRCACTREGCQHVQRDSNPVENDA